MEDFIKAAMLGKLDPMRPAKKMIKKITPMGMAGNAMSKVLGKKAAWGTVAKMVGGNLLAIGATEGAIAGARKLKAKKKPVQGPAVKIRAKKGISDSN